MIQHYNVIRTIENQLKVKCLHNEIRVISHLMEHGPSPSLSIMRETGRSISGHNADLKNLMVLGAIEMVPGEADRRHRLYALTADFAERLRAVSAVQ